MAENYEFIGNIGQGMSGQVYKAKNKKENKIYAIKKMNFNYISEKDKQNIENEVNLLKSLKHPNIVTYKDSFFDKDNNLNIVMIYCEGGDMYTRVRKQKGSFFDEEQILDWMVQLCLALNYVHNKQILHRDIKTQNIFIQNNNIVRIGDFGIAKNYNQNQNMGGALIGTPLYMAPEVYSNNKKYSFRSDIWSLGCCLYEICNLKNAFEAKSWNAVYVKVSKNQRNPINSRFSFEMKSLVDSMLVTKPQSRITLAGILEKSFMKPRVAKYITNFIENYKKYDGDEEQVNILKEQAEQFGIFNVNINKEIEPNEIENKFIQKDQEDLKNINDNEKIILLEHKKEIEQKLSELTKEKMSLLEARKKERANSKKVMNQPQSNQDNNFKSNSLGKEKEKDNSTFQNKTKINSLEKKIKRISTNSLHQENYINQNGLPLYKKPNKNIGSLKKNGINNSQGNNINQINIKNVPVNKKNVDMKTEPGNLSMVKEIIKEERDEQKQTIIERNKLTKITQEIGKLKKELELIKQKLLIDKDQYSLNKNTEVIDNTYRDTIENKENQEFNEMESTIELQENNYKENLELLNNNKEKDLINERIKFYKLRCINTIGEKLYKKSHDIIYKYKNYNNVENSPIRDQLISILGTDNIAFWNIIEQIILLEELQENFKK